MQKILEVKNLTTVFQRSDQRQKVIDDLSFDLFENETLAIVGESGSGKTLTMLSIMRLLAANAQIAEGDIFFQEKRLTSLTEKEMDQIRGKEISMVFQDALTSLNPSFTIGDQLMESPRVHLNLSHAAAKKRALELLEMVGLAASPQTLAKYPHMLSGGQRQRVMIAIALSCTPKILIADEPTTALDVSVQAQIMRLLMQQKQQLGMSMLLVTHNMGLVAQCADRVLVMFKGKIVEQADVFELFRNPQHAYTKQLLQSIPHVEKGKQQHILPLDTASLSNFGKLVEVSPNHFVRQEK